MMGKFIIEEITADGFERFVKVKSLKQEKKLKIHFLSPTGEYVDEDEATEKVGDTLKGNLVIDVLEYHKHVVENLFYIQPYKYCDIYAIVEIINIYKKNYFFAKSSIQKEPILIELSGKENLLKKGDQL